MLMPIWRGLFTRICVQRCLAIPLKAYMKLLVHAFYCLTPATGLIIYHNNQNNKKSTKMKTLRYIGIAIFAVVMCVNFAACSSDDDEEDYQWNDNQNTSQTDQEQNTSGEDNNGNGSGNNTKAEKPDISFFRVAAKNTILHVDYKINNSQKAKVTKAKIYFGENSNPHSSVNAHISGNLIWAEKAGLKRKTTYYVKCQATGEGGTTTTSTTKCMTK